MSEVKVNKISPRSGTNVTLGDSGDTITIPAGATFDASNATTTLPANVVTTDGTQTLTNKSIDASQLTGTITPSDNTVSLAKLTATGTKDATTFLRGDNTFDTPSVASLSTASGSAPSYSARAWVNFDGTGTPSIRGSGNVSSITDNGTGDYTVNFTTAMSDANYAVTLSATFMNKRTNDATSPRTASAVGVLTFTTTDVAGDSPFIDVSVFR